MPPVSLAVLATITLVLIWGLSGCLTDRYAGASADRMEARGILQSEVSVLQRQLAEVTEKNKHHRQPAESGAPSPEYQPERSILQSEILVLQQKLARATEKNKHHRPQLRGEQQPDGPVVESGICASVDYEPLNRSVLVI